MVVVVWGLLSTFVPWEINWKLVSLQVPDATKKEWAACISSKPCSLIMMVTLCSRAWMLGLSCSCCSRRSLFLLLWVGHAFPHPTLTSQAALTEGHTVWLLNSSSRFSHTFWRAANSLSLMHLEQTQEICGLLHLKILTVLEKKR